MPATIEQVKQIGEAKAVPPPWTAPIDQAKLVGQN
jgi:hypothetical protein